MPPVQMYIRTIASGDSYWTLAGRIQGDNQVTNQGDMQRELQALNRGLNISTIGNCVVLIRGWQSSAHRARAARQSCTARIRSFRASPSLSHYTAWETEIVRANDSYPAAVRRAAARRRTARQSQLYQGREQEYANEVARLNIPTLGSRNALQAGDCIAMPVGWIDPNIGTLPRTAPTAANLNTPANQHVLASIAVLFGEQPAHTTAQQLYIWYCMRLRIQSASFPPTLSQVALDPNKFHAYGGPGTRGGHLFNPQGTRAYNDLRRRGGPTLAAVRAARDTVLNHWSSRIPPDAGRYYFHWLATYRGRPTWVERRFNQRSWHLRYPNTFARERALAIAWARHEGWTGSGGVPVLKRHIRPAGGGRVGTMWIFE